MHPSIGRRFVHHLADGSSRTIAFITAVSPAGGGDMQVLGPLTGAGRVECRGPTIRRLQWQGWFWKCVVSPRELAAGVRDDRPPRMRVVDEQDLDDVLDEGW